MNTSTQYGTISTLHYSPVECPHVTNPVPMRSTRTRRAEKGCQHGAHGKDYEVARRISSIRGLPRRKLTRALYGNRCVYLQRARIDKIISSSLRCARLNVTRQHFQCHDCRIDLTPGGGGGEDGQRQSGRKTHGATTSAQRFMTRAS